MLHKLSYIAIILLVTNCLQSHDKVQQSEVVDPVFITAKVSGADVVSFAKEYLGTTYRYAGIDPAKGFDCSGFVYFVFRNFNIELPRGSGGYEFIGTSLKPEEFKVGDVLVFYGYLDNSQIGHVGIICEANGMKSRFIHASSGKAYGVTISDLGSEMYTRRFYKCIDVIQ